MQTVSFTAMKQSIGEDYRLLAELEKPFLAGTAKRVLRELAAQAEETLSGYPISRLEHVLQRMPQVFGASAGFYAASNRSFTSIPIIPDSP